MKLARCHSWKLTPQKAIILQRSLAALTPAGLHGICPLKMNDVKIVAGADVSYSKINNTCYAAVVLFSFPDLAVIEEKTSICKAVFPYIPGLLSFREAPPLVAAFSQLRQKPDVLVLDAQGMAHPRRFGLATHIGYLYDMPSIGCAKTLLTGAHKQPGVHVGNWTYLKSNDEIIGCALRSKTNCKPIYVSPGYLMDVDWALRFILRCLGRCRLPEITRRPHFLSNEIRLSHLSKTAAK